MSAGTVMVYTASGLAAAIGVGVCVLAATPWRLEWKKSTEPAKNRWRNAGTVVLAACGVIVVGGGALLATNAPTSSAQQHPLPAHSVATVQFTYPRDVPGQLFPKVGCVANVAGTATIPAGDVLVLGSEIIGGSQLPLQADVKWSIATSWHATAYFGKAGDANHLFVLEAVVMPEAWEDYLLNEALYYDAKSGVTWWSSGKPPAPAHVEASVKVRRLAMEGQCA
jgi:hypothetical protein